MSTKIRRNETAVSLHIARHGATRWAAMYIGWAHTVSLSVRRHHVDDCDRDTENRQSFEHRPRRCGALSQRKAPRVELPGAVEARPPAADVNHLIDAQEPNLHSCSHVDTNCDPDANRGRGIGVSDWVARRAARCAVGRGLRIQLADSKLPVATLGNCDATVTTRHGRVGCDDGPRDNIGL
jgi:hypothetical protein